MKYLQNTPHLDPLPSSDEGRGNPAVSVKRTPVCVCERSARFPLPFGRGEDQGEGLLRKTFVSLTKWKWGRGGEVLLSHNCSSPRSHIFLSLAVPFRTFRVFCGQIHLGCGSAALRLCLLASLR